MTGENTATMKTRMGSGANRTLSIKLTDDRFYASIKDDGVRSRGDINAVDSALLVEDPAPVAEADPVATVVAAMNGKFHCEYERSNNSFDLHLGSHSNDSGSLLSDVGRGTWKVTKNADGTTSWTRMINSSYETQPISVESDGTIVIETGRSEDGDVRCTKRS
ncbi:MAG: hypothetical protein K9G33_10375 [Sneathiella sp.]|nr:hypothetical protein [Sneathiella sp.]